MCTWGPLAEALRRKTASCAMFVVGWAEEAGSMKNEAIYVR